MSKMNVNDYKTGNVLGSVELSDQQIAKYNDKAQQPQGTVLAGDVLTKADQERLHVRADQIVYLD